MFIKQSLFQYLIEDAGLERLYAEIREFESTINASGCTSVDEYESYCHHVITQLYQGLDEAIKNKSVLHQLIEDEISYRSRQTNDE